MKRTTHALPWLLFAVALALSCFVSLVLIDAQATWGLGQVIAAGPVYVLVFWWMVLNPAAMGAVGLLKSNDLRRLIAAAIMLASVLLYTLFVYGYFGPVAAPGPMD